MKPSVSRKRNRKAEKRVDPVNARNSTNGGPSWHFFLILICVFLINWLAMPAKECIGDARAVRERASVLPPDLQDARIREFLAWATAEIERSGQKREYAPADSLRRKRNRRMALGGAVAVCAALAAILVPIALRQRPASERPAANPRHLTSPSQPLATSGNAPGGQGAKTQSSADAAASPTKPQPGKPALPAPAQSKPEAIPAQATHSPRPVEAASQPSAETAVKQPGVRSASPPVPPVTDCGPGYHLPRSGYLRWASIGAPLASGGVLVLGGPDESLAGGQKLGAALPGCEVGLTPMTAGITIEEPPSRADGLRRVKLRNTSGTPVSSLEVRWEIK